MVKLEEAKAIETIRITETEYNKLRRVIYDRFGINLGDKKKALIAGRLNKVLRQMNYSSFNQFYDYVMNDSTGQALSLLVDRISTNHTYFNRENDHFDYFRKTVIPAIEQKLKYQNSKHIRIWSAGCSSGEEPYTLAMLFLEYFGMNRNSWDIGILATDISTVALDKARKGIYTEENAVKLPAKLREKYLSKTGDGNYSIKDNIKSMILYRRFNLMNTSFPFKNKFHTIFCRNVMIYFDKQTREELANRFYDCLENSGYLFIGHSETLGRDKTAFKYIQPAVYLKDVVG